MAEPGPVRQARAPQVTLDGYRLSGLPRRRAIVSTALNSVSVRLDVLTSRRADARHVVVAGRGVQRVGANAVDALRSQVVDVRPLPGERVGVVRPYEGDLRPLRMVDDIVVGPAAGPQVDRRVGEADRHAALRLLGERLDAGEQRRGQAGPADAAFREAERPVR